MQLTYDDITNILDLNYIPTKRTSYSLNPVNYKVIDLNIALKYNLPDNVKVSVTMYDVRVKSNFKINQTLLFTEKSFFIQFLVLLDHVLIHQMK